MENELSKSRVALSWPLQKRLQAKVLYVQGKTFKEIAALTGIPKSTVYELVNAMGWKTLRGSQAGKEKTVEFMAEAERSVKEWVEVLGVEAQELALKGADLARDAVQAGSTKDYANAARGAHTFAQLARQSAGLDSKSVEGPSKLSLNFFVARVGDVVKEKNVTPAPIQIEASSMAEDGDLGF